MPLQVCVFTTVVRHFEKVDAAKLETLANHVREIAKDIANQIAPEILATIESLSPDEVFALPSVTSAITDAGDCIKARYEGAVDAKALRAAKKDAKRVRAQSGGNCDTVDWSAAGN